MAQKSLVHTLSGDDQKALRQGCQAIVDKAETTDLLRLSSYTQAMFREILSTKESVTNHRPWTFFAYLFHTNDRQNVVPLMCDSASVMGLKAVVSQAASLVASHHEGFSVSGADAASLMSRMPALRVMISQSGGLTTFRVPYTVHYAATAVRAAHDYPMQCDVLIAREDRIDDLTALLEGPYAAFRLPLERLDIRSLGKKIT